MATVVITKNVTGSNIVIEDLGISIPSGSQTELTELFNKTEIGESKNLDTYIIAGDIVINDGTSDLSAANGFRHVNFETEWEDEHALNQHTDFHYEWKTSEEESGTSSTSWQEKISLQTANVPSGTYKVEWFYEWSYSRTSSPGANYGVHINWGAVTLSELEITPNQAYVQGAFFGEGGFGFATLGAGSHKIALNWHSGHQSNQAYIRRARIDFRRVS